MSYFSRWRTTLIVLLVLCASVLAAPNLFTKDELAQAPDFMPKKQLSLGLDLQGGAYLLLQADSSLLKDDVLTKGRASLRQLLRDKHDIVHRSFVDENSKNIVVTLNDKNDKDKAVNLIVKEFNNFTIQPDTKEDEIIISVSEESIVKQQEDILQQSLEVIRKRVDPTGTREVSIQPQGSSRILVQIPGISDNEELAMIKESLKTEARLSFHLAHPLRPHISSPSQVTEAGYIAVKDASNDMYVQIDEIPILSGDNLTKSAPQFGRSGKNYEIAFSMDVEGSTSFSNATKPENRGRLIAIVLDDEVISYPAINEQISTGSASITGQFTLEEATNLSNMLNAGALPVPLEIIQESTIGPSLGHDSIEAGIKACIVGILLVIVFMVLTYKRFGVIATIALIINLIVLLAALSVLGATLTLPGIAGIVLTVGMSVDANVIIFERIKEELQTKLKEPFDAVTRGYRLAMRTIMDANITTIIAAAILYQFGTGPIRGFAVTLSLGVITSFITAIFVTRELVGIAHKIKAPNPFVVGWKFTERTTTIPFVNMRLFAQAISIAAVVATAVTFVVAKNPLNLGLDFVGGAQIIVNAKDSNTSISDIRDASANSGIGGISVINYDKEGQYLLRVPLQGDESNFNDAIDLIKNDMKEIANIEATEMIGGAVSKELRQSGIMAVSFAIIAILLYIWISFEWQFGIAAVIALTHDVILTLGFFALTRLDFSLSTLAAVLTIAGYSINDTVVVFDRIRENMKLHQKMDMKELLNLSLNQTLSRTLMTSITTLLALMGLYFLASETLKVFSIAMIFGVLVGTFSSLFIATPLLLMFNLKQKTDEEKQKELSPYGDI